MKPPDQMFDDPETPSDRHPLARREDTDRRQRALLEASFVLVAAGVAVLFMLPRFPIHGVRRLGGGLLLGFGGWLDFAAHREWKESTAAIAAGLPIPLRRLPRGIQTGLAAAGLLATLLLTFAHRR